MLWRASDDPVRHSLFIDFTIWANATHGAVMLVVTPLQKGMIMTFIEGVPLLVIVVLLIWLRPRTKSRFGQRGGTEQSIAINSCS